VEELSALAVELGQPAYRGRQLSDCLLQGARSTDDLHTVPAPRGASAAGLAQHGAAPGARPCNAGPPR